MKRTSTVMFRRSVICFILVFRDNKVFHFKTGIAHANTFSYSALDLIRSHNLFVKPLVEVETAILTRTHPNSMLIICNVNNGFFFMKYQCKRLYKNLYLIRFCTELMLMKDSQCRKSWSKSMLFPSLWSKNTFFPPF